MGNILMMLAILLFPGFMQAAQAEDVIRINGSGAVLDMLQPMVAAYRKENPKVAIKMEKPLGSSGAIKALLAGVLDIAASSKPLKPEEIKQGAIAREYGRTPLLFVANREVKQENVTGRELEEIYAGRRTNWSGGASLRLILRPEGDVDTTIIRGLSPAMDAAVSLAMKRPGMLTAVTDPEAAEAVVKTPGAMGAASLTTMIVARPDIKPLTLNGVKASVRTLADGSYPLAKDIRFVISAKTSPQARKFLDFVYSAKGRAIAERNGVLVSAASKGAR